MKKIAGLIVSGVCAASAFAQPGNKTQIDMKARLSGTNEWLDVVDVATGVNDAVNIEIGLFLYRDSGYRMGGTTCTIMTNSWNDGDSYEIVDHPENSTHPDGREPYFNFGGQAQTGYITGIDLGRLRIAAQNNPNDIIGGGISIKAHSYSFDTSDGLLAYRFKEPLTNTPQGVG